MEMNKVNQRNNNSNHNGMVNKDMPPKSSAIDPNDTITWSQISEPAYVSDDEDKKRDAEPKGCCTKKRIKCYICLGIVILIVVLIIVLWQVVSKRFFNWLEKSIEDLAQSNSFGSFAFFIGAQFAFSWFVLPGLSYFNILMSFFMKNLLKAWLIATFGAWFAAILLFILIKLCFKEKLTKKFANNSLYKVLSSEVRKNPWKTATFINILFIPTAFKNYTIPLTDLTLIQYMLPSLPFYMFFSFMLTLIGSQISDLESVSESGFSNMTFAQKVNFILGWVLIVFTIVIVVVMGKIAGKKMKQIKKEERMDRASKKKNKIRLGKYETRMKERRYPQNKIDMKIKAVEDMIKMKDEEKNSEMKTNGSKKGYKKVEKK
jgi:uncharacterized membrane protein YdjX (TVP38/TMEM64 family)